MRAGGMTGTASTGHKIPDANNRIQKVYMKIRILEQNPDAVDSPLVAVAVHAGDGQLSPAARALDQALNGAFSRARAAGDFDGRPESSLLFYGPGAAGEAADAVSPTELRRFLFVGLGDAEKTDPGAVRAFAARAVRRAEELRITSLHLVVPVPGRAAAGALEVGAGAPSGGDQAPDPALEALRAAAEGLALAAWDFRELRSMQKPASGPDRPLPPLVDEASVALDLSPEAGGPDDADRAVAVRTGLAFAEGENFARTLQQRPGNVATPEHLAAAALQLAADHGFASTILGPREMETEKMGALLSVAAGSEHEPRFIVLEHRGGKGGDAPLVLVGKGLTFDTGGVSIKPAAGMEDMKFDMSGGAAVLGAMKAIGILNLPLNVVGVVPSSENTINGRATKPGDVIHTRAGKTVEVINTDAEGRLILADALDYAVERFSPRAMVDCATLTGACVIALGHQASALFGTDEELVTALREAGDRSGERCWPLPLWDVYRKQLDSPVADLKNVGGRPAGSITAAMFLKEFVGNTPWAHLDIAGTAYGEPIAPWQRKGGFGVPTRLLLEWVQGHVT
ncbi:MAG: leucyl aminopeptidase [Gemmatimonadales bacterium]|nr:MAG: leucyl aminopeptidase [Gemmatimonadales bacterium]